MSRSILSIGARFMSPMAQDLKTHEVIPDVVDKIPGKVLEVTYPSNIKVQIGKVLTPTQVKDKPEIKFDAEQDAFYTICMTGKNNINQFLICQ